MSPLGTVRSTLLLLAPAVCALPSMAQVILVDASSTAGASANGTTWALAYPTIEEAIEGQVGGAGPVDVLVAEGTYIPSTFRYPGGGTDTEDFTIQIKEGVRLRGGYLGIAGGAGASTSPNSPDGSYFRTVLQGNNGVYHVVVADGDDLDDNGNPIDLSNSEVVLDGFRITNGGVAASASPSADYENGGGLFIQNEPEVLVENVTFDNNSAERGGGAIYYQGTDDGAMRVRRCTLFDNVAKLGGAVLIDDTTANAFISNCILRGNGSDIAHVSGFPPATTQGGAIRAGLQTTLEAANLLIYDNVAQRGGGIYYDPVDGATPGAYPHSWRHCTIVNNLATAPGVSGGGIHINPGRNSSDTMLPSWPDDRAVFIDNCIVWGNRNSITPFGVEDSDIVVDTDGIIDGIRVNIRHSLTDIIEDLTSSLNPNTGFLLDSGALVDAGTGTWDPEFTDPAADNYRLKSISDALNAASSLLVGTDICDIDDLLGYGVGDLPLDLRGNSRIINVDPDMGAYERP